MVPDWLLISAHHACFIGDVRFSRLKGLTNLKLLTGAFLYLRMSISGKSHFGNRSGMFESSELSIEI